MYFVEMAFSWMAQIVLSVDLFNVEDFNHAMLARLLMCGSSNIVKY